MASNLETIGLGVNDRPAFEKLVTSLAEAAQEGLSTPVGDYQVWRSRSGAEVWLHIAPPVQDGDNTMREIMGLTPFFNGNSEIALNITDRIKRPEDNAFEGAYQAWVGTSEAAAAEGGDFPVVFDAVDFAAFTSQTLPATCRARISGFSRELKAFPDEAAFSAAQAPNGLDFSAQSFFPVGLMADAANENKTEKTAPSSNALINGIVKSHRELVNELTNQSFHWLEVESITATFDVLAASNVIKGEIKEGGVVQASCWLFGRILK